MEAMYKPCMITKKTFVYSNSLLCVSFQYEVSMIEGVHENFVVHEP